MLRDAGCLHQVGKHIDGVIGPDTLGNMNSQALPGVFVDHHHQLDRPPVIGPIKHEVPGPDMVGAFWPEPDTGTIV